MKTLKEELIDFLRDYRREFELNNAITYIPETTWIDGYLKNIRSSSRLCERRANGSNSKAKEVETVRWRCLLCGRDKFTRKSPHNCNTGFRKRHLRWEIVSTD